MHTYICSHRPVHMFFSQGYTVRKAKGGDRDRVNSESYPDDMGYPD